MAPDATLRRCPKCNMKLWPTGQVRPIRFHHMRHSTASLLMMAGANPAAVQRIMRHSDPRITTEVYGHLAPGYLRTEINRLAFGPPPPADKRLIVATTTAPFATRLLPPAEKEVATRSATPSEVQAAQVGEGVGARGFEPPASCSQSCTRVQYRCGLPRPARRSVGPRCRQLPRIAARGAAAVHHASGRCIRNAAAYSRTRSGAPCSRAATSANPLRRSTTIGGTDVRSRRTRPSVSSRSRAASVVAPSMSRIAAHSATSSTGTREPGAEPTAQRTAAKAAWAPLSLGSVLRQRDHTRGE